MKYFDELIAHLKLTAGFNHTAIAKTTTDLTALESKLQELETRLATVEARTRPTPAP
jgi:BMFP domain-containing protein YqiC